MNVRENFEPQEWFNVMNGPSRAGLAVILASPSGLTGVLAEATAITQEIRALIASHPTTPLLAAMADAYEHTTPEELRAQRDAAGPQATPRDPKAARDEALQAVRQVMWLVTTKATPEDREAYGALLVRVAERVAGAAKEGGFLGFGGVQVSDAEREAIEEIRRLTATPGGTETPPGPVGGP
ncbi:hypothetical protein [Deinococcus pimensis]|uniref:hypothetical protein n=1 Tax=Deinococcus pimensis TaxID=309888 RepID=UPI0005EBB3A4|nr:hypothetical protein [Deinococcus pimensis]